MRRLLLGFALVLAAPAFAQAAVNDSLAAATRWMAEGEFERALARLDTALARAKEPGSLARLQLARGQCLLALTRRDKALEAFTAALRHDVSVELPADAGPDTLEVFEKARAAFPGTMVVTVDGDAIVRIDERNLGPAPLTTRLPPGSHVIEATTTDGRSERQTVQVKAGASLSVKLVVAAPPRPLEPAPPPVVEAPRPALPAPVVVQVSSPVATRSRAGWIPVGVGAAAVVAGGVSLWQARVQYTRLGDASRPPLSAEEEQSAVRTGTTLQTLGWIGVGAGVAAAATGVVMLVLPPGKTQQPRLQVSLLGNAGWVGVSGELP